MAQRRIVTLRKKDKTYQEIADSLNENGYKTSRGKAFKRMSVKRLYDQAITDNS